MLSLGFRHQLETGARRTIFLKDFSDFLNKRKAPTPALLKFLPTALWKNSNQMLVSQTLRGLGVFFVKLR
jgi:hypothetical protein